MDRRVYTVTELAEILNVSAKTIYKMIREGTIAVVRVRGQFRITDHELRKFLKEEFNE